MTNKPLVEIKNLTKSYNGLTALNNVTLDLMSGRIIGLLGPNGSGKTTLIKLITGLLTPNSGSFKIDDKSDKIEIAKIVSYLPERNYLNQAFTVSQTLDFFKDFYIDFDTNKALTLLDELSVPIDVPIKQLSKGTKEKVQLVLVMSRKAKLYILDEPIGGVDPATRDYILSTILDNFADGASIIISTHLISDIEKILDDIILIKEGNIVLNTTADELRDKNQKSVDELFREVFRHGKAI